MPHQKKISGFLYIIGIYFLLSLLTVYPAHASSTDAEEDYVQLFSYISEHSMEGPLYPFAEFQPDFDEQNHRANLSYFKNNPELISKIKTDLNGGHLRWKLEEQKHRFLFVPEKRDKYERLYERYCKKLVHHILEQTKLDNPYNLIVSLHEEKPEIPPDGVTAFLIHNLAKESIAKYVFSSDKSDKTSVMKMRETDFVGQVGSFTTNIYPKSDGTFEFVRDKFTIWQNNAKNPYTALMVPAEETLHILLREYTERAIKQDLQQHKSLNIDNIQTIADNWLAVEEAIVGGLVRAIVPSFLKQFTGNIPTDYINQDLETKKEYGKYCYLGPGIQLVELMGIEKAINMYSKDPLVVKTALAEFMPDLQKISSKDIAAN
jgi:hypothetical protein